MKEAIKELQQVAKKISNNIHLPAFSKCNDITFSNKDEDLLLIIDHFKIAAENKATYDALIYRSSCGPIYFRVNEGEVVDYQTTMDDAKVRSVIKAAAEELLL